MSASNSAAKKRRAPIEQPRPTYVSPNASIQQQVNTSTPSGLTLPQVIALIDKRLVSLESFKQQPSNDDSNTDYSSVLQELTNEMDSRFEIFIEELANLKNVVMSLQSYTMDVNKMLLEERSSHQQQLQTQQIQTQQIQPKKPDDSIVVDYSVVVDYSNGVKTIVAPVVAPVVEVVAPVAPVAPVDEVEDIPEKIVIEKVIPEKGKKGSRTSV